MNDQKHQQSRVTDQQPKKEVDIDTIILKIRLAMSFSAITRVAHLTRFRWCNTTQLFSHAAPPPPPPSIPMHHHLRNQSLAIKRQTEINKHTGKSFFYTQTPKTNQR